MNSSRSAISPLSWAGIALAGIFVGVAIAGVSLANIQTMREAGLLRTAWFAVLIPLALGFAAFLFGAMKSFATYRGKQFGGLLELGGPAVVALLVILIGIRFEPQPTSRDLVISFETEDGAAAPIASGRIVLRFESGTIAADITSLGTARITALDEALRTEQPLLKLESADYVLGEPNKKYGLTSKSLVVKILPAPVVALGKSLNIQYFSADGDGVLLLARRNEQLLRELGSPLLATNSILDDLNRRTSKEYIAKLRGVMDIGRVVCILATNSTGEQLANLDFLNDAGTVLFGLASLAPNKSLLACTEIVGKEIAGHKGESSRLPVKQVSAKRGEIVGKLLLRDPPPLERMARLASSSQISLGSPEGAATPKEAK